MIIIMLVLKKTCIELNTVHKYFLLVLRDRDLHKDGDDGNPT